ncbi:type II toxin-antitoxin system RelE/ParE family toxin [Actinomyces israelii]|uniref:Type II toxin-antitoxin system RelE/ParE family toxin n=1 Tax=Actinomyces israelii TaxID=1659 RepID=A0ABT4I6T2_9ACTO|nr:type II toxin-antitoxin system RelE/ParE family toxin [Actinomyces israelii]MCZ0857251.1 type II toxin-antitoxin system RelE/ParE family toxin [Actinomyces israelii]
MAWEVILWEDVESWLLSLDDASYDLVVAAIDHLAAVGPALRRPLVDRLIGSRYHNLKELRPGSSERSEIRILFAFDSRRRAVLLIAGDKRGRWQQWYRESIPLAELRFDQWLRESNNDENE